MTIKPTTSAARKQESLLRGIIDPAAEKDTFLLSWIWLGALFLIGLLLWGFFLNFGAIPVDFHDWAEVNAPRIAFLKDAVTRAELPLHMQDSSALRGITDRYMALPDVILSPQIILLRWIPVQDFVLIHVWLLYAFGFFGLIALKKELNLSLLSFSWIFLLFNFNGHLSAHLSVGHVTWAGTFLFSWVIVRALEIQRSAADCRWLAKTAFLLFFMFLQGAFHQFVWCLIFFGFLAFGGKKSFFAVMKLLVYTGLLSAVRILPPTLHLADFDSEFLGGFSSPGQLVRTFFKIIPPADSLNPTDTGSTLGWWEFDLFIGIAAGLFLLSAGAFCIYQLRKNRSFLMLLLPITALTLFSLKPVYSLIHQLPIPLLNGERVSSRFLILPFSFWLAIAAAGYQKWLNLYGSRLIPLIGSLLPLPLSLAELWSHLTTWRVTESVKAFPYTFTDLGQKVVANHPDPAYTNTLLIGLAITLITSILLAIMAIREQGQQPVLPIKS